MSKQKKIDKASENKSVPVNPEEEASKLAPIEETTSTTEDSEEPVIVEVEPEVEPEVVTEPPFKVMPGAKKHEGPTVKERVPQFRDKVLKLYKKLKPGEKLTEKQFAKRLKLKDPKDIQAAGIAWHYLFDEGLIAVPQFYKPLTRTNR